MSEEFKIEKGIPMPNKNRRGGRPGKWILMEVGDSVFLAGKKNTHAYSQYGKLRKSKGMSFSTRTVEESGVKGIRVWRTA